jgi:hypothetical protein
LARWPEVIGNGRTVIGFEENEKEEKAKTALD